VAITADISLEVTGSRVLRGMGTARTCSLVQRSRTPAPGCVLAPNTQPARVASPLYDQNACK